MTETRDPEKWVWTEADFDRMGWHDCVIHALAFRPERYELLLDLDYMFEWVKPRQDETHYRFWIAPAVLVFENAHSIRFDVDTSGGLQIMSVKRASVRRPKNADYIVREEEWEWEIDLLEGQIALWSVGYKLYVRSRPILNSQQYLKETERGGFSFQEGHEAITAAV